MARYDRSTALRGGEREALALLAVHRYRWPVDAADALARLIEPIDDALDVIDSHPEWWGRSSTRGLLLAGTREHGLAFWGWDRDQWLGTVRGANTNYRPAVAAVAYLLCDQRDLHHAFRGWKLRLFTRRVFGRDPVDRAVSSVQRYLDGLGAATVRKRPNLQGALYDLMLLAGSPLLEDLAEHGELLAWMRARETNNARRYGIEQLTRTLVDMGVMDRMPFATQPSREEWLDRSQAGEIDVPPEWLAWTRRWFETSPLARTTRMHTYYGLIKAGRWLHAEHPDRVEPESWDRELAAAWIAAVNRLKVGELSKSLNASAMRARYGEALSPRSKASLIGSVRTFFCDLQEWEWIERRFDPRRALGIPRSIAALIGPEPRVIADDIWAKLMWAGLNLQRDDLPVHGRKLTTPESGSTAEPWYPLELVRAVALLWLFAGLRVDEILRLPVGAIRWHTVPDDTSKGAQVCLLDVPTNKTTGAFTKPVDRLVGEAVEAWQAVRPAQPRFPDRKTGELVDMLLAYRGARLGEKYINRVLVPLLCGKAGVPREDLRGAITSHRARATIATQLYNAKDPMSLFELQAWLGHANPSSTQHYARITPLTLTKAYTDAGYFARNIRTIEVLLDRDAITNGSAGTGGPFEFYDLGHGYCTYTFFEQCPHRMACARCDFYLPKQSSEAQLLEAKEGLQEMLVQVPLTDTEHAAVEGDQTAIDRLLAGLARTPTPTGSARRDPGTWAVEEGHTMSVLPARSRAAVDALRSRDQRPGLRAPSRAPLSYLAGRGRPLPEQDPQQTLHVLSTVIRLWDPLQDLTADALGVDSDRPEDLVRAALANRDKPEQHVLGTDLPVPQIQGHTKRQFEHLLRRREERQISLGLLLRARSEAFPDQLAHGATRDPELCEHLGDDPVLNAQQRHQLVLGLNHPARGRSRLLLSSDDDLARLLCELLEHTTRIPPLHRESKQVTRAQTTTTDSRCRDLAHLASPVPCRESGGLPSPSFAGPPAQSLQGRELPSPHPMARFRSAVRPAFRATSTTGSPQGGNQR